MRPTLIALFALTLFFPWLTANGCGAPPLDPPTTLTGSTLLAGTIAMNPLFAIGPALLIVSLLLRRRVLLSAVVTIAGCALTLYPLTVITIVFLRVHVVHAAFFVAYATLLVVTLESIVCGWRALRDWRRTRTSIAAL